MICVICGKTAQKTLAGYSVCPAHATTLDAALVLEIGSAEEWHRKWRKHHLESQGVRY